MLTDNDFIIKKRECSGRFSYTIGWYSIVVWQHILFSYISIHCMTHCREKTTSWWKISIFLGSSLSHTHTHTNMHTKSHHSSNSVTNCAPQSIGDRIGTAMSFEMMYFRVSSVYKYRPFDFNQPIASNLLPPPEVYSLFDVYSSFICSMHTQYINFARQQYFFQPIAFEQPNRSISRWLDFSSFFLLSIYLFRSIFWARSLTHTHTHIQSHSPFYVYLSLPQRFLYIFVWSRLQIYP